jgi:hypothetical protein
MGKVKKSKKGASKSYRKPKTKRLQPRASVGSKVGTGMKDSPLILPVDNPFEVRMNKRKHDNLGKRGRNEQGVPGISRSRAFEKVRAILSSYWRIHERVQGDILNISKFHFAKQ